MRFTSVFLAFVLLSFSLFLSVPYSVSASPSVHVSVNVDVSPSSSHHRRTSRSSHSPSPPSSSFSPHHFNASSLSSTASDDSSEVEGSNDGDFASNFHPTGKDGRHYGVDLYDGDKVSDWDAVIKQLTQYSGGKTPFVIRKLLDGITPQKRYLSDVISAAKRKAKIGVYAFMRFSHTVDESLDAIQTHRQLIADALKIEDASSIMTALDVEYDSLHDKKHFQMLPSEIDAAHSLLTKMGPSAVLYTNPDFYQQFKSADKTFPWGHLVWVASSKFHGELSPAIWQYGAAPLNGWKGNSDADQFSGTEEQFQKMFN